MAAISKARVVNSITVDDFFSRHGQALGMSLCNENRGLSRKINEPTINRPGLALAGFYEYFANKRIQVLGAAESAYLQGLDSLTCAERFDGMLSQDVPCVIFARDFIPSQEILECANRRGVCLFRTSLVTMKFINLATIRLETEFAEHTTIHGCMVDIRGIGILIRGKSGIGKSETAIGLIERGGCLVADDIVRVKNVGGELVTSAPEMARGYIEVRGLGIVNVTNLFGLSALRLEKRLDLVVSLVPPVNLTEIDRLGLERKSIEILGVPVTHIELPVAPGRDTTRLIEVAAIDQQLKSLGYDMAKEFNTRLMSHMNHRTQVGRGISKE